MHALLLKRFLQKPRQIAYVVPSSTHLVRRVANQMDFSGPKVIVEFGPGEGCHTREILRRMHPASKLLLIELDETLAKHLKEQFKDRPEVIVVHGSAADVLHILAKHGFTYCDYVVSGIPFSWIPVKLKQEILESTHRALRPSEHSALIVYQVSRELRDGGHCDHFERCETEYCLLNFPPMWISAFYRSVKPPLQPTAPLQSKGLLAGA